MRLDTLKGLFRATFSQPEVDALARETGAFERFRDIHPFPFLLSVLAAISTGPGRSIAAAHRAFELLTGVSVAHSSFDAKLAKPETAAFFWRLFAQQLLVANRHARRAWPPELRAFVDILIEDGTQMRVRGSLAERLRSTQPGQAALKLLTRMSLATGQVADLRFAAARHHDHPLRRGALEEGALYLRDLGFYDHTEFAQIHDAHAFFISLLNDSVRPVIYQVYQGVSLRGDAYDPPLDGTLTYGPVVDVDAFFRLEDRSERLFRVVQIEVPVVDRHDLPTGEMRRVWLVTNLDRDEWSVPVIAALYRLRYACIERLFRSCKHLGRLDHLNTGRMPVVMVFVVASWIVQTLADRMTQQLVRRFGFGGVRGDRVMSVLVEGWSEIMRCLFTRGGMRSPFWDTLWTSLVHHGRHPNPSQPKRARQVAATLAA
jgi:Transposase DDE domain